jgi:hypothetical protein
MLVSFPLRHDVAAAERVHVVARVGHAPLALQHPLGHELGAARRVIGLETVGGAASGDVPRALGLLVGCGLLAGGRLGSNTDNTKGAPKR